MNQDRSPYEETVAAQSSTAAPSYADANSAIPQTPTAPPFGSLESASAQPPVPVDPENPPWAQPPWLGALTSLLVWVASVISLLLVPLLLLIPYLIYIAANDRQLLANLANDKTFLFLSVLGVIPAHIVTFCVAYMIVRRGRIYPFMESLGLSWPPAWDAFKGLVICGACCLIAAALFGVGALVTYLFPGEKTQLDILIESSYAARVVTAFLAVATAPLVEEVVYRGLLYTGISRFMGEIVSPAFGVGSAIFVVSGLFAAVHFLQYQNNLAVFGVIILVSITLTVVRAITGRLLPCLIIHLVFNGIQAVIILLSPFFTKAAEPQPKLAPGELLALVQHLF